MYPHGRPQAPLLPGQHTKFTVLETLDRIKEEFQLFQAQYHSLKMEYEKLASEKTEMQRHSIMYYEMSYGLNIEMQKQAEIVKRLTAICTQIIPFLSQEHQHQVAQAVERSKHVSMAELNAIIGQQQLQHLSHHASGFPLMPHPSGLSLGAGSGLGALPAALGFAGPLMAKDDPSHSHPDELRDGTSSRSKSASPLHSPLDDRQLASLAAQREAVRSRAEERTMAPAHSDDEGDRSEVDVGMSSEGQRPRPGVPPSPPDGNGLGGPLSPRRVRPRGSSPSTSSQSQSPTAGNSTHLGQGGARSPSPPRRVSLTPGSPLHPPSHPLPPSRSTRTPPPTSL
ncbi:TLE family member 2, transcriptional corepressor c isoform X1 [Alosa pseudoharengus]|uniref:TLE family member 5 isoform X1 n=1 Tax=Alosa sapidissima TaxID=34773 RepID=UPI001C08A3BF|nr:TLE family member 5 isoform X1 [Alosa sapidissima]